MVDFNFSLNQKYHEFKGFLADIKSHKNYRFALGDIDRMVFKEKLIIFPRLRAKDNDLEEIIKSYSSHAGIYKDYAMESALKYSTLFKKKQMVKFRLRGIRLDDRSISPRIKSFYLNIIVLGFNKNHGDGKWN